MLRCSLRIFFGFGSRITPFMWWICSGKNPLHSSRVQESLQIILFMLSFRTVIFVSADSRTASDRNQKFVSLLLISSSSRPNLLCFGFDLNQSQRTIPISRNGCLPDWSLSLTGVIHVNCPCLLTLFVNSGTWSSATYKNVRLNMSNTLHGASSRSSWKACSLKFFHLWYLMVISMFWIDLFLYFLKMHVYWQMIWHTNIEQLGH